MEAMEKGIYGAKVQSFSGSNPRDMLWKIIQENPSADKGKLLALFWDEVSDTDNVDYLRTVVEYWFSNNLQSILDAQGTKLSAGRTSTARPAGSAVAPVKSRAEVREESKQLQQAVYTEMKAKLDAVIMDKAKMIALDLVMPTGKKLRDSTKTECAAAGGWYAAIADRLEPGQIVGNVFTEDQVREVWKHANN